MNNYTLSLVISAVAFVLMWAYAQAFEENKSIKRVAVQSSLAGLAAVVVLSLVPGSAVASVSSAVLTGPFTASVPH